MVPLPLILMNIYFHIFPIEHFVLKSKAYLWFPEFLKVEWEAELSVIKFPAPSSCSGSRHPLHLEG